MNERLKKRIQGRKNDGTLRKLSHFNSTIDFFSNDYLGLSKGSTNEILDSKGSTGSRLLSGNSNVAEDCESQLALFYESESALIFNSGYDANIGLISSIALRGDTILYDEYIHASSRDGIRLSFANSISFKHNNTEDLNEKLYKAKGSVYVLVESLYSMDGDMAPLSSIHQVCKEKGAYLIVDEAHACGVFGKEGRGIAHAKVLHKDIFCRIVTFGKAYGYHGAALLVSSDLRDYLLNFCRSFIYTTALPDHSYNTIESRVQSPDIYEKQKSLQENIYLFRNSLKNLSFISEENSPIQVIEFTTREALTNCIDAMAKLGIYTKPILPPTVPKGSFRVRLCFHSFNTEEEIQLLLSCFL
tara:strand:+ start:1484 stop:2557 length:1074 start_codon:yes stop_codon:yes gene_type:complete